MEGWGLESTTCLFLPHWGGAGEGFLALLPKDWEIVSSGESWHPSFSGVDAEATGRAAHGGRDAVCPRGGPLSAPVSDWQSLWAGPLSSRAVGSLPLFVLHNVETAQILASAIAPAALTASQILFLCSPCRAIHMRHTGLRAEMAQHGHPGQRHRVTRASTQGCRETPGALLPAELKTHMPLHRCWWHLWHNVCKIHACPSPNNQQKGHASCLHRCSDLSQNSSALEFCKRGLFFLIDPVSSLQWALVWRIQGILPLMTTKISHLVQILPGPKCSFFSNVVIFCLCLLSLNWQKDRPCFQDTKRCCVIFLPQWQMSLDSKLSEARSKLILSWFWKQVVPGLVKLPYIVITSTLSPVLLQTTLA